MTIQPNSQLQERKTVLFSEWIRRAGFWTLDFLTGSRVRTHYADIKHILENLREPRVSSLQAAYLNSILAYATKNVEFYKKFGGYSSLKSFPVVNKNIIRDNYAAFQSPEFLKAAVVNMHTSGSTGTPFVVRQDKNKRDRVFAEMMYFWEKGGYQIGMKYMFLRIWTSINRKDKLTAWARNIVMYDICRQNEENLEEIRKILKSDHKIRMLLGYSSALENLANYLVACGDTPEMYNIGTVIGFGDVLPISAHEKLKKVFASNVIALYSNQENGMLAPECVANKEFHVNSASYYIELLENDSDEPVDIGEPGRIVVTDLFNHAMPMIRYDTGDIGVWKNEAECGWHSQSLASVQGAMSDLLFDTKGSKIYSDVLSVNMWPFDKLKQFQFIQEGTKQYTLKLNGAKGHYDDAQFVDYFKGLLGQDAEIMVEHVSEIPVLASGKRRIVVNNYIKEKI